MLSVIFYLIHSFSYLHNIAMRALRLFSKKMNLEINQISFYGLTKSDSQRCKYDIYYPGLK